MKGSRERALTEGWLVAGYRLQNRFNYFRKCSSLGIYTQIDIGLNFTFLMNKFKIEAPFKPMGDQPDAIAQLTKSLQANNRFQTLLGATGTGKTFTVALVIAEIGRPTLVLAHNKTLAAQLCNELRQFFPQNAVEYFISYYHYCQP